MRVSQLMGETLHTADAEIASHALLLRAGYIRQLGSGIYSNLPLAWRSLRKIEQILREELDRIGGQELSMPVVHPASIWQETGRWEQIDSAMLRFRDRLGRDMCLAMTHEEVVADLARSEVKSYRQLPMLVYQIQTKFRDEPRARGGLIRVREFLMKDSYSLDRDEQGLKQQYARHYEAYFRIFARVGLPVMAVSSDVGMMGGKLAHEYMYLTPIGEDTLALCDACGYAANREVARFAPPEVQPAPLLPMEKVHTPDARTIEDLARFLKVGADRTCKAVFYTGSGSAEQGERLIVALVRGDHEVNPTAVQSLAQARALRPATAEEIRAAGIEPGYGSAVGLAPGKALVIADALVAQSPNLVAGANEPEFHLVNTNHGRDWKADQVGFIAAVSEGAACPRCAAPLRLSRGVEVGNIFQLGTRYSQAMGCTFTDEQGQRHPIVMGSYGIGVGRLLACVAEQHHDERGLALPISVAPYALTLLSLARKPEGRAAAERIYEELRAAGVELLFDDRELSTGAKFADCDLRGTPLRLIISDRGLAQGTAELKHRLQDEVTQVPLDTLLPTLRASIAALHSALEAPLASLPRWSEA